MTDLTIGGLFEGYGGLTMAIKAVLGGRLTWYSEHEPPVELPTGKMSRPKQAPARLLARRYPDIPNLGDITTIDWAGVDPVEVLGGGFPCQDVSHAGKRRGMHPDTRSGLWSHFAYAIDVLRPRLVVAENVRGLLSAEATSDLEPCPWCMGDGEGGALRALGAVLGDLADLGYDAEWVGLRAADVGAPHGRFRVFVVAWPAGTDPSALADPGGETLGLGAGLRPRVEGRLRGGRLDDGDRPDAAADPGGVGRDGGPGVVGSGRDEAVRVEAGHHAGDSGRDAAADAGRAGREGAGHARPAGRPVAAGGAPADAASYGRNEGGTEPAGLIWRPDAPERRAGPAPDATTGSEQPQRARQEPGRGGQGALPDAASDPGRVVERDGRAVPDTDGQGRQPVGQLERPSQPDADRRDGPGEDASRAAADAQPVPHDQHGAAGRVAGPPAGGPGEDRDEARPGAAGRGPLGDGGSPDLPGGAGADPVATWGPYEPAIRRWEHLLGRLAPPPTVVGRNGGQRLNPAFAEWMMGVPAGWITDPALGLTANEQLKLIGNGVVPQQAAAALAYVLARAAAERVAA